MRNPNKKVSILVFAMLIVSLFTVFPMGRTDTWSPENSRDISISDTDLDDLPKYIGQQDVVFDVTILNGLNSGGASDHIYSCNLSIKDTIRDEEGEEVVSPISSWDKREVNDNVTINDGDSYTFQDFQFDVEDDADPGRYNLTAHLDYENETGASFTFDGYIVFDIERNAVVSDGQPNLWAGKDFQRLSFDIENTDTVDLNDVYLTLDQGDFPDGVELVEDEAYLPGSLHPNSTKRANYRVDVDPQVSPDTYTVDYTLTAGRAGVNITETGTVDFIVDYTPKIEARVSEEVEVEQGTEVEETINVTFENIGNVDLREVYVGIHTDGNYFVKSVEHYEYGEDVSPAAVELDDGELQIGESGETNFTIGIHRNIQEGEHQIEFYWDGWYYNDGSTGDPSEYKHVGVDWDLGTDPDEGLLYEVNENDTDNPHRYNPAMETPEEQPWPAPHVTMSVKDEEIDMEGSLGSIELERDLTYTPINVALKNYEHVSFKDIKAELVVGANTPFYNPEDHLAQRVEMEGESTSIAAASAEGPGTTTLTFIVDINRDYINDTLSGNIHAYSGDIVITEMVNTDTNEKEVDQSVPIVGELVGIGPRLVVEGKVSENDIRAGETFWLNYTIENKGDDTARDVFVTMQPDQYDHDDWEIIKGFVETATMTSESTYYKKNTSANASSQETKQPVSVALTMDYSASMNATAISNMEQGAKEFVNNMRPGDRAEIIKFATDVEVVQPFTSDKSALINAIESNASVGGATSFYDSVYQGLEDANDETGSPAVIGLTDGEDNDSNHTLNGTITTAQNMNIPVYTIGLGDADNTSLSRLASDTGGEYYYAATYSDIQAIYKDISKTIEEELDTTGGIVEKESKYTREPVSLQELDIDSAKEIIDLHMYVEETLSSPQPYIWTLYKRDIPPGESTNISFQMVSSKNMQMGKPYRETILIKSKDSNSAVPHQRTYNLTIRSQDRGESYSAGDEEEGIISTGESAIGLAIVAILIVLTLIALMISMFRKKSEPVKEGPEEGSGPEEEEDEEEPELEEEEGEEEETFAEEEEEEPEPEPEPEPEWEEEEIFVEEDTEEEKEIW